MADAIAHDNQVDLIEVLTGFKYIGREILKMENGGKGHYAFGFEESYGCLIGTHARDKDAVVATMALCEAAAFYKAKGMTLWDAMLGAYERYGYYYDGIKAVTLKGISGGEQIAKVMETLRQEAPKGFGGESVLSIRDYAADTIKDLQTGETYPTGLPKSNVLYYALTQDAWVCVRPSGTEPKIKFYYGVRGENSADAEKKSAAVEKDIDAVLKEILG